MVEWYNGVRYSFKLDEYGFNFPVRCNEHYAAILISPSIFDCISEQKGNTLFVEYSNSSSKNSLGYKLWRTYINILIQIATLWNLEGSGSDILSMIVTCFFQINGRYFIGKMSRV